MLPNFRALGPKVGKQMPLVKERSPRSTARRCKPRSTPTARYDLALDDGPIVQLGPDDVEVRAASHEELALAQEGGYAVALDTTLDDELRAEGIARELIRAAQRPAQGRRASRSPTASACARRRPDASKPPRTSTATGSRARCCAVELDGVEPRGRPTRVDPRRRSTASRSSVRSARVER